MDRRDFYYKQPVQASELNDAFDDVENAVDNIVVDYGINGLISGLQVLQHGAGDLTVNVDAGVAYDSNGKRIAVPTTQNVNCAVDYLAVSTAVSGSSNSKFLSLFAVFSRSLTDARTDGNGSTVYFDQAESFALEIHQGTEATSPSPVALIPGKVLLADIEINHTTTAITTGVITFTRTQYYGNPAPVTMPAVTGTRFSLSAGVLTSQMAAVAGQIDSTLSNGADTILQYASVAALRAANGGNAPSYTAGAVATIPTFGLFVWTPGSSATDDGLFVVKPTNVSGSGRWVSMTAQLGANSGLAQLDSAGRLAIGKARGGIINVVQHTGTNGTTFFSSLTVPSCVAGDIVLVMANVGLVSASATNWVTAQFQGNENAGGATDITGMIAQLGNSSGGYSGTGLFEFGVFGLRTIGTGGNFVITRVDTASSGSALVAANHSVIAVQWRP